MDPALVGYYPSWETLPHERLSPRSDTVGRRLAVLRPLVHPGDDPTNGPLKVEVAPVRSVLQPQVKGLADLEPVEEYRGDIEAAVTDMKSWLTAGSRVVLVNEGHGPAHRMVEVLKEHDVPVRLLSLIHI